MNILSKDDKQELDREQEKLREKYRDNIQTQLEPHEESFTRSKADEELARAEEDFDKLAHALFVQGKYDEALDVVVSDILRARIERVKEVIYREKPVSCSCPDTPHKEKGHTIYFSRHYTLDTVYSPVTNTFVRLNACKVCGLLTI